MMKSPIKITALLALLGLSQLAATAADAPFTLLYSAEASEAPVTWTGNVSIDNSTAAVGARSFRFGPGPMGVIELAGSRKLQHQFTLGAFVKIANQSQNMRLFSNYSGQGKVASDAVLVDLLMTGSTIDLRMILGGKNVRQPLSVDRLDDGWHHIAIVFDRGQYAFFLDGKKILKSELAVSSLSCTDDLRFGEDLNSGPSEQFVGHADHIMVLASVMSDDEIDALANSGVELAVRAAAPAIAQVSVLPVLVQQQPGATLMDFAQETDLESRDRAILGQAFSRDGAERQQFIELQGDAKDQSHIVTRPFRIQGGERLLLNLDASKGFVLVEVLDTNGNAVAGYDKANAMALIYDASAQQVKWNSHAALPQEKMDLKLRITGHGTKIYACALQLPADPAVLDPGLHRQLFADYWLVDKLEGQARLDVKRPADRGVVMTLDQPWEGNTCAYATFLHDEQAGKYRLYFRGWNHVNGKPTHDQFTCYAESVDGVSWTRPNLNKFEYMGSKANNIVLDVKKTPNAINGSFTPFIDTNPDAKATEKFKAIGGESKYASFLYSPNGIDWETYPHTALRYPLDSQQALFWHPLEKQYRVYLRAWYYGRGYSGVRGIKTATSKDLINWSNAEWLVYPDAPREQLYTNNIINYSRAPQLTIGFPCRLVRGSNVEPMFMISRDGETFHRWGETIVTAGQNPDKWGNRCNYMWYGMVETDGEYPGVKELSVYTHERYYRGEGVKLRRYTYRLDGFVSVYAPFSGGAVITKPMKATGTKLAVNYSTAAGGEMVVEVLDENGRSIATSPAIYGDKTDEIIKLNIPAAQIGRTVSLKFSLKDAEVFAFRFVQ